MLENDNEDGNITYSDEFVVELDRRWEHYLNGRKTYSLDEIREESLNYIKEKRKKNGTSKKAKL
ncbi:MAG: hypothetical protein QM610_14230 [Chitinophagaceae bacterium]